MKNATYKLTIQTFDGVGDPFEDIKHNYKEVASEFVITQREVGIWVEAHLEGQSCESPKTMAVLNETVKYLPPKNVRIEWSSNSVTLKWDGEKSKTVIIDVQFRRMDDPLAAWENKTIQTNSSNDMKVKVTLENLQHQSAYQVRIRQKPKHVKTPLWSDWTPPLDVPSEIKHPPEVNWTEQDNNGSRLLKLTWDAKQYHPSAGRVTYNLSIHDEPCRKKKNHIHHINASEFTTTVTYSAVDVSIFAFNIVGRTPSTALLVPAIHKKTCFNNTPTKGHGKACLEWYKLTDRETGPERVNIPTQTLNTTKDRCESINLVFFPGMEDYVRYYYLRHSCHKKKRQTTAWCTIYKQEGAPTKAPLEFNAVDVTYNSAVLNWKPIPVPDLQGFLKHYEICITANINQKDCKIVSESHTEYTLEKLTPESLYNISVAGVTVIGSGPKANVSFKTVSDPFTVWMIVFCMIPVLIATIMVSFLANRLKIKFWSSVPAPVLRQDGCEKKRQNLLEVTEKVDELSLQKWNPHDPQIPNQEKLTILDVCEIDEGEDDGEQGSLGELGTPDACVPLSPDYKSQVLSDLGDLETTDTNEEENDCEAVILMYRDGLVFDMKANSTEDLGTELST
ncbi:interleukin-6 receptor subunit beta isoform X2 [Hypomesus transpacificus]|nr:interleukin-6 receptor subunit beta isoform X2 [Hypomesus transpacificus]